MSQGSSATILLIGSFLPASQGSFSVGEGLAAELANIGFRVQLTSRQPNRILRLLDMLHTIWRRRSQIDLALVEVYSGTGFRMGGSLLSLVNRYWQTLSLDPARRKPARVFRSPCEPR